MNAFIQPMFACAMSALMLFGTAGCCTAVTPAKPQDASSEEKEIATWSQFLTRDELLARAEKDSKLAGRLREVWPELEKSDRGPMALANPLLIGFASWAGKQIWGLIARHIKAEADKHAAEFGAMTPETRWATGSAGPVAIELRRSQYSPKENAKTLFHAIVVIRPASPAFLDHSPSIDTVYQLVPVYWREDEPAAEKVSGGKLSALFSVELGVLDTALPAPERRVLTSVQWVLKEYSLGEVKMVDPDKRETIVTETGSSEILVKGPAPSPYFAAPSAGALLLATLKVAEADASNVAVILRKLGEAFDAQDDVIGTIIEGKLGKE